MTAPIRPAPAAPEPDADGDRAAVLNANAAFYRAFQTRDINAMEALWAHAAPVACIHPGWDALTDRAAVLLSWREILGHAAAPTVACRQAQAFVHGEHAFVICHEIVGGSTLVATNQFVREAGRWLMSHHQASPLASDAQPRAAPRPRRQLH